MERGCIKSPVPVAWFGGKSRVATEVWQAFGDVDNYVEPFAGSLAVLLGRPHTPRVETVNDLDCYLANFWRAIRYDPVETAQWADWPVNEADLLARHKWLMQQFDFRERMRRDPEFYDVKIAGWWVWGLCSWIGEGWCVHEHKKLPHLGNAGRGILDYFIQLHERLRRVRVACGEWDRVLGDSVTVKHGVTGVFLDPPYDSKSHDVTYSANTDVSADVRQWAIDNGDNPLLRIALCGYEGEHEMPPDWRCMAWKAIGGYASLGNKRGRENAGKERIWFGPACMREEIAVNQFQKIWGDL